MPTSKKCNGLAIGLLKDEVIVVGLQELSFKDSNPSIEPARCFVLKEFGTGAGRGS
jgi:hypothetical protein